MVEFFVTLVEIQARDFGGEVIQLESEQEIGVDFLSLLSNQKTCDSRYDSNTIGSKTQIRKMTIMRYALLITFILTTSAGCTLQHSLQPEDERPSEFGLQALYLTHDPDREELYGGLFSSNGFFVQDTEIRARRKESASFHYGKLFYGEVLTSDALIKHCTSNGYSIKSREDWLYCVNESKVEFKHHIIRSQSPNPNPGVTTFDYEMITYVPYAGRRSEGLQVEYFKDNSRYVKKVGSFVKKVATDALAEEDLARFASKYSLDGAPISLGERVCLFTKKGFVYVGNADRIGSGNVKFLSKVRYQYTPNNVDRASRVAHDYQSWHSLRELSRCPSSL